MKTGYEVLKPVGMGLYIEVYNYASLNQIGHYRYSNPEYLGDCTKYKVGTWKPKLIKN